MRNGQKEKISRDAIKVGDWIKVRGSSWQDDRFVVFRMDRVDDPARRKVKLKARLDEVGPDASDPTYLELAGFRFVIDDDTDFEDFPELVDGAASGESSRGADATAASGSTDRPPQGAASTARAVTRAERELDRVQLYKLEADSLEHEDVSREFPEVVSTLMNRLDRWEARHGGKGQARVVVDAESAEKLRSLGYIQ